MNVVISPVVIDYLENLTFLLHERGYFGFYENACEYVDKILEFIYKDLPTRPKRVAPKHFSKFGKSMFYVMYRPNKRTTWYIFFNLKDRRY